MLWYAATQPSPSIHNRHHLSSTDGLHLASPRHIPSRLRQRLHNERPSHQPPTPPEFLGESSPDPSSAATSPRSGSITPNLRTAQTFDIHSDIDPDHIDDNDNASNQTQDATYAEQDIFTMLTQHTPPPPTSQPGSSPTDGFSNHPFSFGAPPFNIQTPFDTPLSHLSTDTPPTQRWLLDSTQRWLRDSAPHGTTTTTTSVKS